MEDIEASTAGSLEAKLDTLLALHTESAARMAKHEELLQRTAARLNHLEEQGGTSRVNSEDEAYKLEQKSKPRKGKDAVWDHELTTPRTQSHQYPIT